MVIVFWGVPLPFGLSACSGPAAARPPTARSSGFNSGRPLPKRHHRAVRRPEGAESEASGEAPPSFHQFGGLECLLGLASPLLTGNELGFDDLGVDFDKAVKR